MGAIPMQVTSWRPRQEKLWRYNADGSITAHIYTFAGVVEVFSYPGDNRHREFTSLEMFIYPHRFQCTLPRQYHERWLRRLAGDFAERCRQEANR